MKKTACLAVFFGLCVLAVSVGAGEMHTWTASKGDAIEAEFVDVSQDGLSVTLRKKDGDEIQMVTEELSKKDQDFIKQLQNFTGIRCEYRAATGDGSWKDVFLLKAVFPGSPAEKAGLRLTSGNLYFRPAGAKAKPEDIIDGFYHPKTRVASIAIRSGPKEPPKTVKVNCISKPEWEILVAAEEKREAAAAEAKAILAARAKAAAEARAEADKARKAAWAKTKPTMDGFNRIRTGMTHEEVADLVGIPSEIVSEVEILGNKMVEVKWNVSSSSSFSLMRITFKNGKVSMKHQIGLE